MFGYELIKTPWYKRPRIQVGRGNSSGKGNYSGKGHKGQNARSGKGTRANFEGWQTPLTQRLPKLRGFKRYFKLVTTYQALNLSSIQRDERFTDGSTITHENLTIRGYANKNDKVKILGNGDFSKKVSFSSEFVFSATAKEKIAAAGGSIAQ